MNNDDDLLLKLEALKLTRLLMESDDLVCVKLSKLKLLSNLILHTLQDIK
jgi:hypothetical protein